MAKNLMTDANVLQTSARPDDGIVTKGMLIKRGSLRGIALNAAGPGEPLRLAVSGVWNIAKIAKVTAAERAYWAGRRWAGRLLGKDIPPLTPALKHGARVYGRADLGVEGRVTVSGRVGFGSRN